jgi:hypothetical protein
VLGRGRWRRRGLSMSFSFGRGSEGGGTWDVVMGWFGTTSSTARGYF